MSKKQIENKWVKPELIRLDDDVADGKMGYKTAEGPKGLKGPS